MAIATVQPVTGGAMHEAKIVNELVLEPWSEQLDDAQPAPWNAVVMMGHSSGSNFEGAGIGKVVVGPAVVTPGAVEHWPPLQHVTGLTAAVQPPV